MAALTRPADQTLRGPYTTLQGLIANQREAQAIILKPRRRATRQLGGTHQSRLKGRGMEFDDVRGYQPGDDVRNIDWRVTARTTVAHTKTFTEERERPVLLLCDQRSSMYFGSRLRFKSVQAANLASLLAWSALRRKDRVGGLLLGTSETREFRPRSGRRAVLTLLAGLNRINHDLGLLSTAAETPLRDALAELRRVSATGSTIFLVSDFHDLDQECLRQLYELSRHNSVTAISVFDPLERELPPAGIYSVAAAQNGNPNASTPAQRLTGERVQLDTSSTGTRRQFARQALQRAEQVRHDLQRLGLAVLEVDTTEQATEALARLFQRARGSRRHA